MKIDTRFLKFELVEGGFNFYIHPVILWVVVFTLAVASCYLLRFGV